MFRSLCFLLIFPLNAHSGDPIFLGVLENYLENNSEEKFAVRFGFEKNDKEWKVLSDISSEINWTIAFDGQKKGELISSPYKNPKFIADKGRQEVKNKKAIPKVGNKSLAFSGWPSNKIFRPLVAISRPNFRDPDKWKPVSNLDKTLMSDVLKEFHNKISNVKNCAHAEDEATSAKPWRYSDNDIKVIKIYGSNKNWKLIGLQLTGYKCDGIAEEGFYTQWFSISPEKKISFISNGMELVDAGDYDADGQSEVLFFKSGYNRDGYLILYENLSKSAEFEYSFH